MPIYKCVYCKRPFVDYTIYEKHRFECMKEKQKQLDKEWEKKCSPSNVKTASTKDSH